MCSRKAVAYRHAIGHSLIELMVAIVIGLILVLASFQVLATFEGHKRTVTAMNDALQSGGFGLYTLDKLARSAGTGLVQAASFTYGCLPSYTTPGGSVVSDGVLSAPLAAPFAGLVGTMGLKLRLAPAVIFPGATPYPDASMPSDALLLMSGGAGFAEVPIPLTQRPATSQLIVDSTVGFRPLDWVLVGAPGMATCMITTLAGVPNNVVLSLNGSATLSGYANGYVVDLGNSQTAAASFTMYGIDANNSLSSVDLLNSNFGITQLASDDIVLMRAVYGVDPGATGTLIWTRPQTGVAIAGKTYDYSPSGLLAGTPSATIALRSIKAIRVALIVRAPLMEKADTSITAFNQGSYTLFGTLPAALQVIWNVPSSQANYRFRELEGTIPLRNTAF
jgi:type IV pilus assembly protein PilW